jgi:hypothetical protein
MDTRCSARARATQTIGQLSAIRCVRTVGTAWQAHSASSTANSQEVARLFTGFSIKRRHKASAHTGLSRDQRKRSKIES